MFQITVAGNWKIRGIYAGVERATTLLPSEMEREMYLMSEVEYQEEVRLGAQGRLVIRAIP